MYDWKFAKQNGNETKMHHIFRNSSNYGYCPFAKRPNERRAGGIKYPRYVEIHYSSFYICHRILSLSFHVPYPPRGLRCIVWLSDPRAKEARYIVFFSKCSSRWAASLAIKCLSTFRLNEQFLFKMPACKHTYTHTYVRTFFQELIFTYGFKNESK